MSENFSNWGQLPQWSEVARHFGRLMERLDGGREPLVGMLGALAVERMLSGHVCVDLREAGGNAVFPGSVGGELRLPMTEKLLSALRGCAVVGEPGASRPLILDAAGRLYLLRQWRDEQSVAEGIRARLHEAKREWNPQALAASWRKVFAVKAGVDWQQVAVFAALRNRFTVISGGPGTGKTRTIGGLLALLRELQPEARVLLAAPTGKAAARLQEAVAALGGTTASGANDLAETKTLHRLLGARPGGEFRRNAEHPLAADWVIVDEASMVDLTTMAALMRALPMNASLVLVGDKDQLASVETGAVLGDVCAALPANRFTPALATAMTAMIGTTLPANHVSETAADAVVHLQKNYRQAGATGAWQLSECLNAGDVQGVTTLVKASVSGGDLHVRTMPEPREAKSALRRWVEAHWPVGSDEPLEMLARVGSARVLTALRDGPQGVRQLNRWVEEILVELGRVKGSGVIYPGRPLLVTENDHTNRLFNGDVGVLMEQGGRLKAAFPEHATGSVRWVDLARLPAHETVYAMTIHKSQGSEFDDVLLLLPGADHPLLTRELVYTGLTRARRSVEIWAPEDVIEAAAVKRAVRSSGLVAAFNSH